MKILEYQNMEISKYTNILKMYAPARDTNLLITENFIKACNSECFRCLAYSESTGFVFRCSMDSESAGFAFCH